MPGRHIRHAAPLIRGRGRAPAVASRISAMTTVGVFVMAILIGVMVEHSIAPRLGMGYGFPAAKSRAGGKPPAAVPPVTRSGHPARHTPAVKHRVASLASLASVPGAVRLTMVTDRGAAAAAAFGGLPGTQPFVDLIGHEGSYAFGTAAIGVPAGVAAMPQTALFLARASGSSWHVALDGTSAFAQLLLNAPGGLIPDPEKQVLAQYNAARQAAKAGSGGTQGTGTGSSTPSASGSAGSPAPAQGTQTGLSLPWKASQPWTMVPDPGKPPTGADPLALASFAGGDGRVLAAGPGRLYRFCASGAGQGSGGALIELIHSDGSATEYYQLDRETTVHGGSPVRQGAYLGHTGTSLACGGSSRSPDVEFSLLRSGGSGLNGAAIGGWTFHEALQPLRVWAQRGSEQILPGAPLRNLGALAGLGGV